jgi:SAM-dependent methyltransferase
MPASLEEYNISSAREYWDTVAKDCVSLDTNQINDNWWKRQQLVKRLLNYNFIGKRIIEIGCGVGITGASIRNTAGMVDYLGVDLSPIFCNAANKALHLVTKEGEITNIPAESNHYHYMFLFDVLEHIHPRERERGYQEINRVLKANAIIFINNPITQSGHDEGFDFGFNETDLAKLCEVTKTRIEELSTIRIKPNGKMYEYQFIVLLREL